MFRRFNINLNQWSLWTFGWDRRALGGNVNTNFTFRNYWNGWMGFNRQLRGMSPTQLRGGPGIKTPSAWNGWMGFETDSRRLFRGSASGWFYREDETGSLSSGLQSRLSWRPTANIDLSVAPRVNWNRDEWQYLASPEVLNDTEYLFGRLHQTTTALTFRSNVTVSTDLSLQLYAEPFVSSGRFAGYRKVVDPQADAFNDRFQLLTDNEVTTLDNGNVGLDMNGDGGFETEIANPDFTYMSLRTNLVLRWEYSLGSTLFVVWQHGREENTTDGTFRFRSNLSELFHAPARNVFLIKVNYWISP